MKTYIFDPISDDALAYARKHLDVVTWKDDKINSPSDATPYILNFSFLHKKASVITEALSHEGIYVSSVSACHSKGEPVSYVLLAMGLGKERASNSMRISLSSMNELEEAKIFIAKLNDIIERTIDR